MWLWLGTHIPDLLHQLGLAFCLWLAVGTLLLDETVENLLARELVDMAVECVFVSLQMDSQ